MSHGSIPILHLNETEQQRAQRHVNSAAHTSLAEIMLAGVRGEPLDEPVTSTAYCRRSKLRIVVRLVRYDGVTYEPTEDTRLSPTARAILGLCRRDAPVSGRTLARKLGRTYSSYFRAALTELVKTRRLVRVGSGYRKP